MVLKNSTPIILFIFLCACQPQSTEEQVSAVVVSDTVVSLLGETLMPIELSEEVQTRFDQKLTEAQDDLAASPDSLDLIIWHGRRLAYLGRYREAVQVFTDGLDQFPNSYRLYRHRGHRFITTRFIDNAIEDYERAASLSASGVNNIEPDGLPNSMNVPLGNDKFNIYYHLGLAHYVNGNFTQAIDAYEKCMGFSYNDDLISATSYWLYMTAQRTGNDALAGTTIARISPDMEIVENRIYLDLLLLFNGTKTEEELLELATNENGSLNPTYAYGISNWYMQNDRMSDAKKLLDKALESPQWNAFGYIASEAEVGRWITPPSD